MYAEDFAHASPVNLFTAKKLSASTILTADYFDNVLLVNQGNMQFEAQPLPREAQFTAYRDAVVVHANNDELPDILLAGNYYDNNIEMGRYDADFGAILLNRGNNTFTCESINGLSIKGQARHIRPVMINKRPAFIIAKNNDSTVVIRFELKSR